MNKFHNIATVVDGVRFASKKEARRHGELKLMQRAGEISDLVLQPRFKLAVNGLPICTYVADFQYTDAKRGGRVVEDVKGVRTPVYKIKRALMAAVHSIDVVEV